MDNKIPVAELPFRADFFSNAYGEIVWAERLCPGVYQIGARPSEDARYCLEYYVAMPGSPVSAEARAFGKPLPGEPDAVVFDCSDYYGKGRYVVEYEVQKYLEDENLPLPKGESSERSRVLGMEACPEYFGEFPTPIDTPWGRAKRFIRLQNGIFWLDVPEKGLVLAVAYPYCGGMNEEVLALAALPQDAQGSGEEYYGYRFYPYSLSPLPIYELAAYDDCGIAEFFDMAALKNTIAENFPDYAEKHNRLAEREEDRIETTPGAGTDFYRFPQ